VIKQLLITLFLFCTLSVSVAETNDDEIKRLLAKPFVKADFVKTRKLKILSRPFITSGKILFLPEKGLVWHTTKPIEDILLIGHKGVSQLKNLDSAPVKIDNPVIESASNVFITIFSLDLEKIKSIFTLKRLANENNKQVYFLEAKDENIRKIIGRIEISGKERVEQIYIEEVSGDSTLVKLKNEQTDKSSFDATDSRLLGMM